MLDKELIVKGRLAVDTYRDAHTQLYSNGWHKGISEEHTPLLDKLLVKLKGQSFYSLAEFWDASDLLNIWELGFTDWEDFEARATDADRKLLEGMWK